MKPQIRTWLYFLIIIGLLSSELTSCKKDSNSNDFAGVIAGTYTGTITATGIGTTSSSTAITRVNDTIINFAVTVSGSSRPFSGIAVSNPSANTYSLTLSDSGGSLTGTEAGNTLNWTFTSGSETDVFTGTK
ncbi:MAG: hypothetical protein ABR974_01610 [Bacteroidales bacterium]|jgi:hypothetical protein